MRLLYNFKLIGLLTDFKLFAKYPSNKQDNVLPVSHPYKINPFWAIVIVLTVYFVITTSSHYQKNTDGFFPHHASCLHTLWFLLLCLSTSCFSHYQFLHLISSLLNSSLLSHSLLCSLCIISVIVACVPGCKSVLISRVQPATV